MPAHCEKIFTKDFRLRLYRCNAFDCLAPYALAISSTFLRVSSSSVLTRTMSDGTSRNFF